MGGWGCCGSQIAAKVQRKHSRTPMPPPKTSKEARHFPINSELALQHLPTPKNLSKEARHFPINSELALQHLPTPKNLSKEARRRAENAFSFNFPKVAAGVP